MDLSNKTHLVSWIHVQVSLSEPWEGKSRVLFEMWHDIYHRCMPFQDARNPRLRENVLLGIISASRLAAMSTNEMASDEMKELRAKLTKEAIDDHQMAQQGGTKSDLFKCSRCGQRDTMYNQVTTTHATGLLLIPVFHCCYTTYYYYHSHNCYSNLNLLLKPWSTTHFCAFFAHNHGTRLRFIFSNHKLHS